MLKITPIRYRAYVDMVKAVELQMVTSEEKWSPIDLIGVASMLTALRHHGSIKQMERIFGISYPTVKNRLRSIVGRLDKTFTAPTPNSLVLEQLSRGEITVDEALERLEG